MKFIKPFLFLTMFASLAVSAQSGMGSSPSSSSPGMNQGTSPGSLNTPSTNSSPSSIHNNSGTPRTNTRGSNQQRMEDRPTTSPTSPSSTSPMNTTPAGVGSPATGTGTP